MHRHARRLAVSPRLVIGVAVIAGLFGTALATVVTNPYTTVIPPLLVVGAGLGHVVRTAEIEAFPELRSPRLLLSAYFTVAAAMIVLYGANGFSRPVEVHALLIALYLLTAMAAFTFDSLRAKFGLVVATGVVHRALVYYASAIQIGMDALYHNRAATAVAETESLAPMATSKYWYAPAYHLITASGAEAMGVSVRHAAFVLVTVVATVVAAGAIYLLLEGVWNETVGLIGAILFVAADKAVWATIHTTPTTLGVALFALLLCCAERYLATRSRAIRLLYAVTLAGLVATHQLSMFIAVVAVSAYLMGYLFWRGSLDRGAVGLQALLVGSFLFQASITRYSGPAGEAQSFLLVTGTWIVEALASVVSGSSSRATSTLPADAGVAVAGSDALSWLQVLGTGLLFAAGVAGAVYWFHRRDDATRRVALCLGVGVVTVSVFVFVLPIFGIRTFLPGRWTTFLYVLLAALAAPGIVALFSRVGGVRQSWPTLAIVCLVVTAPYLVVMSGNSAGAPDGPILDDSPGAERIGTTPQEAALYQFTVDNAGGETLTVSDATAWHVLSRYHEHPTARYTRTYGEPGTTYDGQTLVVYRGYAETRHGSYSVEYEGERYRVYGPLPGPYAGDSIVYSNGEDRLAWRVES